MSGRLLIVLSALILSGCSSSSGVSTGALLGEGPGSATAALPSAAPTGDPTSRAFQVGSTAARAVKCGYNFDPVKLRTNFLANEAATVAPTDIPRIEKVYDTAYNGVAKAVAGQADYCSPEKTAEIKTSLTRHLAGDYAPAVAKKQPEQPGWFSNWGGAQDKGPAFGSDSWWEKQNEAVGG